MEAMNRERREKEIQEKSEFLSAGISIFIKNSHFLEKATDSVQYFLRNNTQYNYESELNDLGREFPSHVIPIMSS